MSFSLLEVAIAAQLHPGDALPDTAVKVCNHQRAVTQTRFVTGA